MNSSGQRLKELYDAHYMIMVKPENIRVVAKKFRENNIPFELVKVNFPIDKVAIGKKLKKKRMEQNYSLEEMANMLSTDVETLAEIEKGNW